MNSAQEDPHALMTATLDEAKVGFASGEVPIAATVVLEGEIISRAHNRVEELQDPTAHAEVLALREAARKLGSWRLNNASLYVTVEPCTMCIGALLLARVRKLYFGCFEPKMGAVGSLYDLSNFPESPQQIAVYPELLAAESQELLRKFFAKKRTKTD